MISLGQLLSLYIYWIFFIRHKLFVFDGYKRIENRVFG
ncbi:hypothetical protein CEV32_1923 [Brucella rhizosphaerae]|uniref:Uncharacterized protein n=1 Tax=Brucella rhizosphaerae TaxID=571254 RepID=A0A256F3Y5_9HYPH|nr:hypothetical protein CEV32_1923 [Brucella rhizosphaerae]